MAQASVSTKFLEQVIEGVAAFGREVNGGITRLVLSKNDLRASEYIADLMRKIGLHVERDQIGNLIRRRCGKNEMLPAVGFGSHIDTVPNGGRFDGVAGDAAGLEVMRILNEMSWETVRPLELIVFVGEEGSRFPFQISTVGVVTAKPGAFNIIPKTVEFTIDLRESDPDRLHRLSHDILQRANQCCEASGLSYSL